ncbi:WD40 repeat domain-containing protein [Thioalkalivibrio sp. ALE16]|uniref:WD40 repeat domain-containing protein n=1 Tax=Thioalkalivibrio sp. ALE16 TaxID=1158172 RepID=UPI0003612069|nr:PQQ-binding-like beta-propeller repeat protein [Thioalkalivibrio sp. ALE16]
MKLDYRIPLKTLVAASVALALSGVALAESPSYRVILPSASGMVSTGGSAGGEDELCDGDELMEVATIESGAKTQINAVLRTANGNIVHNVQSGVVKRSGEDYSVIWEHTEHPGIINAMALGPSGDILVGGRDESVWRIDGSTGEKVWIYGNPNGRVYSIAVAPDGSVYAGDRSDRLYKADAAGNHQWNRFTHSGNVVAAVTDQSGNVYSASLSSSGRIAKHAPEGDLLWENESLHWRGIMSLHMDEFSGALISGGDDRPDLVKSDPETGQEIWRYTGHSDKIRAIATDSAGNIYSGGDDETIRKISPSGEELWVFEAVNTVRAIAVHPTGTLYVGIGGGTVRSFAQVGEACTSN